MFSNRSEIPTDIITLPRSPCWTWPDIKNRRSEPTTEMTSAPLKTDENLTAMIMFRYLSTQWTERRLRRYRPTSEIKLDDCLVGSYCMSRGMRSEGDATG
jgi:hypothetical protein